MAILGFLAHTEDDAAHSVEKAMQAIPELTTYGVHKETHVVAVAETPAGKMEALVNRVKRLDGVLAVYVTSYTTEDEEEDAVSGADLFGRRHQG